MRIRADHLLTLLLVAGLVAGCSGYRAQYDIGLITASRPDGAEQLFGKYDIHKVKEDGPDQSFFEDGFVKIVWTPTALEVALELTNKTSNPIKIIWDDAKFIDSEGNQQRAIHSKVKLSEVDKPQEPSIVEQSGSLSDTVIPADNIIYRDARWQKKPMFPNFAVSRKAEHFDDDVQAFVGKSFKVILPLETDGTVHEYSFTFKISDVEVTK
jgi:hypothetical protein